MSGPVPWSRELAHDMAREMLRIRRLEEHCAELYGQQKIRGFLHLYIGQEAVATGVLRALDAADAVVATYREHAHALIRGLSARAIMAEMYGRRDGCSRGRGGSMHLFDAERRFYGGNAIVGGGLPLAVGLALAERLCARPGIVCCFFGEGAVAEGAFHESLNLAALWALPVLFVCENNRYAMGTALARSESQTDLCLKAASYRLPASRVDGMDVVAVHEAARAAVASLRAGAGPMFLECQTYRFRAHSMFDPELYRDAAEVRRWKRHGPLTGFTDRLRAQGLLQPQAWQSIQAAVDEEMRDAIAFAEASEPEPVEALTRDVYSPAGSGP